MKKRVSMVVYNSFGSDDNLNLRSFFFIKDAHSSQRTNLTNEQHINNAFDDEFYIEIPRSIHSVLAIRLFPTLNKYHLQYYDKKKDVDEKHYINSILENEEIRCAYFIPSRYYRTLRFE